MPRVYAVESETEITMVVANTPTQAINHVVKDHYKVSPASSMDVVEYMQQGGVVEEAGVDKTEKEEEQEEDTDD